MNEKTTVLYQKAIDFALSKTTLSETSAEWQRMILEKFTELVVQECAKSIWEDAPFGAVELIKNMQNKMSVSFEVEELRES
jgi:hypothetical protein